jgi:hypothetical protein
VRGGSTCHGVHDTRNATVVGTAPLERLVPTARSHATLPVAVERSLIGRAVRASVAIVGAGVGAGDVRRATPLDVDGAARVAAGGDGLERQPATLAHGVIDDAAAS